MSVPILDCVFNGIELVGSIIGTRQDIKEALELAKLHKITCKIQKRKLEDINEVFNDMINYKISGRVVIDFTDK
jgi:propanol-preferring alcohol dehydrogenase